jgi:menaquinone-specific isochorismate synthase
MTHAGPFTWAGRPFEGRDPLDVLRPAAGDVVYLAQPARDLELLALGAAAVIEAAGPDRFTVARRAAASLLARVACDAPVAPMLLGGFAFHDGHQAVGYWGGFPSLRLVLPRALVVRRGSERWWIDVAGSAPPAPASPAVAPDYADGADDWHARVEHALADIAAGRLAKVVLSRSRSWCGVEVDAASLARRLRDARPTCTTFLVRRGAATFVGSTPETLVSVRGAVAQTRALAGSMRVAAGQATEEAAASLLACRKNAAEHRYVAEAVEAGLARVSTAVVTTESRAVVRLPEMLHLATSHRARLRAGVSALEVAGVLHPTPAVGGAPSATARVRLAAEEPGRGWYAGGVGWVDAAGDGDWAVALRCALVRGDRVRAFAGAGIVAGSEAGAEWDETEAKMTAMLRLFSERARAA